MVQSYWLLGLQESYLWSCRALQGVPFNALLRHSDDVQQRDFPLQDEAVCRSSVTDGHQSFNERCFDWQDYVYRHGLLAQADRQTEVPRPTQLHLKEHRSSFTRPGDYPRVHQHHLIYQAVSARVRWLSWHAELQPKAESGWTNVHKDLDEERCHQLLW